MTAARPAVVVFATLASSILLLSPSVRTEARQIPHPHHAPAAFGKVAPANSTVDHPSTVTLQWSASAALAPAATSASLGMMEVVAVPPAATLAGSAFTPTSVVANAPPVDSPQHLNCGFGLAGFPPEASTAFRRARDLISALLTSPVICDLRAAFTPLPDGVLADGGPPVLVRNFPGAPLPDAFYPPLLASKYAGVDVSPLEDIRMRFNTTISWHFDPNSPPPPGTYDFVTVALQQMTRGAGFAATARVDPWSGRGFLRDGGVPDAFDFFVEDGIGRRLLLDPRYPEGSIALGNALQSGDLWWGGQYARAANGGSRPKMYAPNPMQADGGSYMNFDEVYFPPGHPNSLMTPFINAGERIFSPGPSGIGVLNDLGWGTPLTYEYCIDSVINSACDSEWRNVGDATSASVSSLEPGVVYEWQVRATTGNEYTYADAGSVFQFATRAETGVRGDFDRDGRADLVVYRNGAWFINGQGTRQLGAAGDIPVPGHYGPDGITDAAVWRPTTGEWIISNPTNGIVTISHGRTGDIPVPADYDGNGTTDFAVFRTTGDPFATWHVLNGLTTAWGARGDVPVPADYDGDRRADPAVYRPSNGTWYLLRSGSGYAPAPQVQFGLAGDTPVPADYDGDGRADLAVFRRSTGDWFIAFASTNYATSEWHQWGLPGDEPVPLDVDGDGLDDLVVYRPSNGTWHAFSRATSAPVLSRAADMASAVAFGLPGDIPAMRRPRIPSTSATDFDGDRRADISVFREETGQWFTRFSSSNYTTAATWQWGLADDFTVPGDYDGDGRTDLAVYRRATGRWYIAFSSTGFATSREEQWGTTGDLPVPQDYDGDGRTDPAVFRPSTGQWFAKLSSTNFTTFIGALWGTAGDVPIPADYDGDGRADFAVYRLSSNTFFVKLTGSFAQTVAKPLGAGLNIPVVADYDGDGRADLAVYSPSIGRWFVLDALTNESRPELQWGEVGDSPVPSDCDGDGIADAVVYRFASGMWFVRRSSDRTMFALQWGLPSDVPLGTGIR